VKLVDSHCHLDFPDLLAQEDAVIARMGEAGVAYALCVAVTLEAFPGLLALVRRHDNLFASVGLHPDYDDQPEASVEQLRGLATDPKVVAIGETGLDYFRRETGPEWQRERFRQHIRAAVACNKPLIIHCRAAAADTLRIMAEEGASRVGGVMHCFTESLDVAQGAIAMGFLISFSGIVTFRSATELKAVATEVPLEDMLVETDSPYLAPMPYRGKTNEPAYVRHVAEEIARLKGVPFETVAEATTRNFCKLFRITEPA
jgi:TatD DNase family protein